MASDLIPTDQVETLVQSGLPTTDLEIIIDGADEEIIRFVGPHDGLRKVVLRVDYSENVYLPQPAENVSEVKEWPDTGAEVDADPFTDYAIQAGGRYLRRTIGGYWSRNVAVTFTPYGDNARRAQVLVDIVKWELARSGHTREETGEYETEQENQNEHTVILARLRQGYAGAGLFA